MFSISSLNKFFVAFCFASLLFSTVKAQSTESFSFTLPINKVSNSLYNKISFIDARTDTTNLGIIQKGAFNKQAKLVANESLTIQLDHILKALIDSTSKPGELILQVRQLRFYEVTGAISEKGYFAFRAELYAKSMGSYKKLALIDTVSVVSAMDVTNKNLKRGSETIANFIASNLNREPTAPLSYSYTDITKIDSIEKSQLKLFTSPAYAEGVYFTYKSFRDQTPDGNIVIDGDSLKKNNVKALLADGQSIKVKPANTYAIVYKGKPYIVTPYEFYPLLKVGNNFVFTGKGSTATSTSVMMGSALFGVAGGMIAASEKSTFEMKIDYTTGQFIRMKEIREPLPGDSN